MDNLNNKNTTRYKCESTGGGGLGDCPRVGTAACVACAACAIAGGDIAGRGGVADGEGVGTIPCASVGDVSGAFSAIHGMWIGDEGWGWKTRGDPWLDMWNNSGGIKRNKGRNRERPPGGRVGVRKAPAL